VRPLRVFLAVMFVVTMLMMVPPYVRSARYITFGLLYLLPQALVVAVPFALLVALASSRPVRRSRHWLRAIVASGVICSAFCFVTLAWWTPSANQAFRVGMAREVDRAADPPRGLPELSLGELRQRLSWASEVRGDGRALAFTYYMHWAFPCASLSLALLMIALQRRGAARRWLLLSVLPILLGYYVMMFAGRAYAIALGGGELTAAVAAWTPNAVVILVALMISARGAAQRATE
jgi:lipopolysaccharide export LptBFGC system permease protein LptF